MSFSTLWHNDPAEHHVHCGRCRIRTRDLCPWSMVRYQWATTSPSLVCFSPHCFSFTLSVSLPLLYILYSLSFSLPNSISFHLPFPSHSCLHVTLSDPLSLCLSPSWPLSPLLMYKELAWLTSRWYINKNIKKSSSGYPPLPPPPPPHNITNNGAQCAVQHSWMMLA